MAESVVEFAEYDETRPEGSPLSFAVRPATPDDAPAVALLDAERNRVDPDSILPYVRRDLEAIASGDLLRTCAVATSDGTEVGYARAAWKDYGASPDARKLPSGWYLTGLVVSPRWRRQGVGLALTLHRLEHLISAGVREVYYFANAENRVTIALHERPGFEEISRDIVVPGVAFHGGVGILYRWRLHP